MKKNLVVLLALVLSVSVYGQDSKVTGFRDLVWGVHKDSVSKNGKRINFIKVKQSDAYKLDKEVLTLGAAKLVKIHYFFNSANRFKSVEMIGSNKYEEDIKDILTYKFGAPQEVKQVSKTITLSEWNDGDVSISWSQNTVTEQFSLILKSNFDLTQAIMANMNVNDIVYDGKDITGFRTFVWLAHKDSVFQNGEKVQFVKDRDATQPNTFYLQNDKLTFGSVRLTGINYVFNEDNQLTKVVMNGSKENYSDVKFILNHKFGGAEGVNIFGAEMSVTEWRKGSTTVKLTESGSGSEFALIITSTKDETEAYIENRKVFDF